MRRHLGMSAEEWTALPWQLARCYRDGLVNEFVGEPAAPNVNGDGEALLREIGATFN